MARIEIPIYGELRESLSKLLEVTEPSSRGITIKPLNEKRLRRALLNVSVFAQVNLAPSLYRKLT